MLVGPVVEGESERDAIPKLLDKLEVRHRPPLVADGKPDLLRRARAYAGLQAKSGATHVLFCFDADSPDGESEFRTLQQRLLSVTVPILGYVPVHALEAWFLADEEALSKVIGSRVEAVRQPEEDPLPARTLDQLFRANGRVQGYLKTQHAKRLAEAARDKRLLRCPSYERSSGIFRRG
jgi:hypothetical protein